MPGTAKNDTVYGKLPVTSRVFHNLSVEKPVDNVDN